MVIIGGTLQENPFFIPPDEFLRELRATRRHLKGATPISCLAIEAEMEQTTDEIKRLQGCINDLISIQSLPAIWSGQESSQIVGTLLDVLVRILRLDFAYVWLSTSIHGSPLEMIRLAQRRTPEVRAAEVGRAFAGRLTGDHTQRAVHDAESNRRRERLGCALPAVASG